MEGAGIKYMCDQFGIDPVRMTRLLNLVFEYIQAQMHDGKSLQEIKTKMLGKDA